jgi:hypothetical protein
VELVYRLENAKDEKELAFIRGRIQQFRRIEQLPEEIKNLLKKHEANQQRQREIEENNASA